MILGLVLVASLAGLALYAVVLTVLSMDLDAPNRKERGA